MISVSALIVSFSKVTLAVERTPLFRVSDIGYSQSFDPQGFNSGDSILVKNFKSNAALDQIYAQNLGNFTIKQIDTTPYSYQNLIFVVRKTNLELGSVTSSINKIGVLNMYVEANDRVTLKTFTDQTRAPNDYSMLYSIGLSDDAELVTSNVSGPLTLKANFWKYPDVTNKPIEGGKIIISNGDTTIFDGKFESRVGQRVKEIYVNSNSTSIFNNGLTLSNALYVDTGGKVIFGPDTTIDTRILTNNLVSINGKIAFLGNNIISNGVGTFTNKISDIEFGGKGRNFELYGNIHSERINIDNSNLLLKKNLTLNGEVRLNSSTYTLGSNTLFLDNATNSTFTGDVTINSTIEDNRHGNIVVNGGNVDFDKDNTLNTLTLNLDDRAYLLPSPDANKQSYIILGNTEADGRIKMIDSSKVKFKVVRQNPFGECSLKDR